MLDLRIDSGQLCKARRTADGYLRVYGRIAKADVPMIYRSATGTRQELIRAADLFNSDSLETFQTLPVTHEHPPSQVVNADNFGQYGKGSTHPTFIKEVTPFGTFLGQMLTVYDRTLADAIEGKKIKGLSPGYAVSTRQVGDSLFEQYNRRGNHLAVVAAPRGGDSVAIIPEGFTTDSEDLIWVCDSVDGFDAPIADLVDSYFASDRLDYGLVEKTPITLNRGDIMKTKPAFLQEIDDDDHEEECDCKKCQKADSARIDAQDLVAQIKAEIQGEMDQELTDSLLQELQEQVDEQSELLDEALELLEADEFEELSDDAIVFDSVDDFAAVLVDAIDAYDTLRSDSALLGVDFEQAFGTRADAVRGFVLEGTDIKQQVLAKIAPGQRTDSLSDEQIDAAYEFAMAPYRAQAIKTDSTNQFGQALAQITSFSGAAPAAPKTMAGAFLASNNIK